MWPLSIAKQYIHQLCLSSFPSVILFSFTFFALSLSFGALSTRVCINPICQIMFPDVKAAIRCARLTPDDVVEFMLALS
jgi:hypothetical protein